MVGDLHKSSLEVGTDVEEQRYKGREKRISNLFSPLVHSMKEAEFDPLHPPLPSPAFN